MERKEPNMKTRPWLRSDNSEPKAQPTIPKRARIETDEDYGNKSYFVYANGQPGDLEIEVHSGELQSWREIVRAVNCHEDLVKALQAAYVCIKDNPEFSFEEKMIEKAIAKAEGK